MSTNKRALPLLTAVLLVAAAPASAAGTMSDPSVDVLFDEDSGTVAVTLHVIAESEELAPGTSLAPQQLGVIAKGKKKKKKPEQQEYLVVTLSDVLVSSRTPSSTEDGVTVVTATAVVLDELPLVELVDADGAGALTIAVPPESTLLGVLAGGHVDALDCGVAVDGESLEHYVAALDDVTVLSTVPAEDGSAIVTLFARGATLTSLHKGGSTSGNINVIVNKDGAPSGNVDATLHRDPAGGAIDVVINRAPAAASERPRGTKQVVVTTSPSDDDRNAHVPAA